MDFHWPPPYVQSDYHGNSHASSAGNSNPPLTLTTDIDPANTQTWGLSLGDVAHTSQSQGHWVGASVSPQLDLAITSAVPLEQLMITAQHVHHPFSTGSSPVVASMRNLTCVGPSNGINESWSPHEDPFAGHLMGNMQAGFYPGSQVVVTSMAPNPLLPSHQMVWSPVQSGMHTPTISENYDTNMERRTSDHSYHSADGYAFTFSQSVPGYSIPTLAPAVPFPVAPASSPVLRPDNQQTSYPNSPGSSTESYVYVEHPIDGVVARRSSEELTDHEATTRYKPSKSPPRRRKASTSESSDNSDVSLNVNMSSGAGVFPTSNKKAKRNQGGRLPGMHLTKEGAKEAREMRNYGSCWRCQLQREKVRALSVECSG